MFKKAFTLAEILITLGIIGVVAAMTMPVLIENYKKKQTVTQLKKIYSALQQSIQLSQNNYGDFCNWDWGLTSEDFFKRYLSSNFSVLKNCGNGEGCWNTDGGFQLNGNKYSEAPSFTSNGLASKLSLMDGTFVALIKQDNNHIHIHVDLNGDKRPNVYGKDIFVMTLTSKDFSDGIHNIPVAGLYMYGHGITRDRVISAGCAKNRTGFTCGELILMDSWDIKNDYPW